MSTVTTKSPIKFHPVSLNSKLAPVRWVKEPGAIRARPEAMSVKVSSTYAPIEQSCPPSCAFFNAASGTDMRPCYADSGFTRFGVRKLEAHAKGKTPEDIARAEARAIDRAFHGKQIPQDGYRGKGRDLRLHVAGDCRTDEAARILGEAAGRWRARGGGAVWTYTHAWRTVERASWGAAVQVYASVEKPEDVALARARGYAAAIVVDAFRTDGKTYMLDDVRVLPCVAETHEATCADCRVCLDRDLFSLGLTIAFAAHGLGAPEVKRRLPVIQPSGKVYEGADMAYGQTIRLEPGDSVKIPPGEPVYLDGVRIDRGA